MNEANVSKERWARNSLVVQWLGLSALTTKGLDSIPDWGTKILQAKKKFKKVGK